MEAPRKRSGSFGLFSAGALLALFLAAHSAFAGTSYGFGAYGSGTYGGFTATTTPSASTTAATSIGTSTAVLNGSITADGGASSTVRGFNIGLTTAYSATTTENGTFNLGSFSTTTTGLSPATLYHYRAYATNSAGTAYANDQTFTTNALPAPVISAISATSTQTTATITWTTDQSASSTVNYGLTASYGSSSTTATLVTSHSITLTGLTASTTYHYQVGGANSTGTVSTSSDQTFTTAALTVTPPTVTTSAASSIATSTAIFNGSITADGNASSTLRGFVYGLTTSYTATSTQSGTFGVGSFSTTTTGLVANTTYHYAAYATNSAGTNYGSDQSFTTASNPAPVISAISATTTQTTATITWTTDIAASSTVNYGLTTGYGFASTSAALVTSHSIVLTGLTASTTYQYQVGGASTFGIVSTSSNQTFTTNSTPDVTPPIVAVTAPTNGSTVSGSSVTLTASSSDNIGVTGVQFYRDTNIAIGSSGTGNPYSVSWNTLSGVSDGSHTIFAVAHDAANNYATSTSVSVTVDNTAPTFSSVAATTTLTTATITWTTNESSDSRVDYGPTASYGTASTSAAMSTSHSIVLSGLANSTTFHYRLQSTDNQGNVGTTTDATFTTLSPDVTPPSVLLTSPTASSTVTGTSISLAATASDNAAVAGVQFLVDATPIGAEDTTPSYGVTWDTTAFLDGAHTVYAVARDTSNNYATSSLAVIVDNTAPLRSAGSPSTVLPLNTSTTTISLSTNENATCKYSTTSGVAYASMTSTFTTTGSTSHSQNISGLTNNTAYTYYVKCQDSFGNKNVSDYAISFSVAADSTVPTVSMTAPTNNAVVGGSSVALSATASDDVAVTGLQFTLDGAPLGSMFTSAPYSYTWDTTSVASGTHALAAVAHDGSGNYATSTIVSVRVDNDAPIVTAISAAPITSTDATINWTTDENATSQVDYGTTASYGSQTTLDSTRVKPHIVTITGLSPSTTYHYRVRSVDIVGNTVVGTDHTFTTSGAADVTPPVISSVSGSGTTNTITLTWTTDEPATSQVSYGFNSSYGSQTTLDSTLVTSHSVTVSGLVAGTTYHLQAASSDASGNPATSADQQVTTTSAGSSNPCASGCGGGGGGGGGGSSGGKPTTNTTTTTTTTTTSTAVSAPVITQNLTSGSSGSMVTALQLFLISRGFTIPAGATGYFGAQTVTALAAYQAAHGIVPAAGYLGPVTRAAIAADTTAGVLPSTTPVLPSTPTIPVTVPTDGSFTRTLTIGSVGVDVLALQQYLNAHGFTIATAGAGSPGNETTTFGPATKAALAEFQAAVGIRPAAGYFGPATRAYVMTH